MWWIINCFWVFKQLVIDTWHQDWPENKTKNSVEDCFSFNRLFQSSFLFLYITERRSTHKDPRCYNSFSTAIHVPCPIICILLLLLLMIMVYHVPFLQVLQNWNWILLFLFTVTMTKKINIPNICIYTQCPSSLYVSNKVSSLVWQ